MNHGSLKEFIYINEKDKCIVRSIDKSSQKNKGKRIQLIFLIFILSLFLCQCNPWNTRKGIIHFRERLQLAEQLNMKEAALYHLTVAKNLIDAAEKQYEDADFAAANQFIKQAEQQYQQAKKFYLLHYQNDALQSEVTP